MFSHSVKVHPGGGGRPGRRDEQKARELDLDALEQTVYASATDLDALEAAMEMATYSAHVPQDAAPGDELELRNPDGLVVRARLVEFGGSPRNAAPRRAPSGGRATPRRLGAARRPRRTPSCRRPSTSRACSPPCAGTARRRSPSAPPRGNVSGGLEQFRRRARRSRVEDVTSAQAHRGLRRRARARARVAPADAAPARDALRQPAPGQETKLFNNTSTFMYSNGFDVLFSLCKKNSPRENDPSKNQSNRLRCDRASEV